MSVSYCWTIFESRRPRGLLFPGTQALPLRLLAVGAFAGVANAPSGAARAHTRKFSPEWFLAVHFAVPFIAMLRKACLMPRWAIAYTVAAAIAGQVCQSDLGTWRSALCGNWCGFWGAEQTARAAWHILTGVDILWDRCYALSQLRFCTCACQGNHASSTQDDNLSPYRWQETGWNRCAWQGGSHRHPSAM